MYEYLAYITLLVHLIFILFVIFGGFLFFIFSKIIYLHIPALFWGIYIEFTNSICPLTYLENWFLYKSELSTYSSSFINNYILVFVYPNNLTADIQFYLGIALLVINTFVYGLIIKHIKEN